MTDRSIFANDQDVMNIAAMSTPCLSEIGPEAINGFFYTRRLLLSHAQLVVLNHGKKTMGGGGE
jgi:hypothetical protein